nr:MAG TPA: hypothetical protein [Caudoviricetes sp.]
MQSYVLIKSSFPLVKFVFLELNLYNNRISRTCQYFLR